MTEYQRKKLPLKVIRVDKKNIGVTAAFLAENGFLFSLVKAYAQGFSYKTLAFSICPTGNDEDGRTLTATDGQFIVIERGKIRVLDSIDFWDEFEVADQAVGSLPIGG